MRSRVIPLSLVFTLLMLVGRPNVCAAGDEVPSLEARVKGAFIFNFIEFTQWPDGTFAKGEDPIVVGILGETPITEILRAIAANKSINGRPLSIRQFHSVDEVGKCQVVVVADQFSGDFESVARAAAAKSILTIGESSSFTDAGGIIRLFIEETKERFEVNTLAAERAHLQISSKLLKLAKIVRK
jgi:hypothetical protein